MRVLTSGYYWAYRKGSPVPEVVYARNGCVYEIWETADGQVGLDFEELSEGKWILGEKIEWGVDIP